MELRKKIAVICNYRLMPERVGGMDRFFWLFDERCKALGYEVTWFFPNKSSHGSYGNLHIKTPEENQPLEHFFNAYIRVYNEHFDFVITHFLELCTPFFKKVKAFYPAKTIAVDHNPRPINGYPVKKRVLKKLKGLFYAKYTDLFVGVSAYTKFQIINDFGNHLQKKTIVVYNGIVHELYEKRTHRSIEKPSFLVASHLRYSKGIQDLIAAVALLPNTIQKELKIDIYGEGDYQAELEKMIASENLFHVFNFMGSVSNLYNTYFHYDYLLQPTHMECFSLSILESLGANVPVITTSVGGNEEVIQHGKNGYIFKPKDIEALKKVLEDLFLGTMVIEEDTNPLIANNFSIEKMVDSHLQLCRLVQNKNLLVNQ